MRHARFRWPALMMLSLPAGLSLSGFHASPASPTTTLITEPSAGITPWISAIHQARSGIDVNAYLLTDGAILKALKTAAAQQPVHVLLERYPYQDHAAAQAAATALDHTAITWRWAPARFSHPYTFDHAKYLITNPGTPHALALFGSPNLTASAFDGANAEVALETTQPTLTRALTAVFHADWTHTPAGPGPRTALVLSPGSEPTLLRLLATPGPIALATEELGDVPAVYTAIRTHQGTVRLLVPATLSASNRARAAALAHAGIQVRAIAQPYLHAKLILTTHQTFVGSQNWSEPSLDANREVGLITANPTLHRHATAIFTQWWHQATPWGQPLPSVRRYPYLPDGWNPAQVRQAWGPPTRITHTTYAGHPETVWVYPAGRVDFSHYRVTDVQRS